MSKITKKKVVRVLNVNCNETVQFNLRVNDGEAYYLREALRKGRRIYLNLFENGKSIHLGHTRENKAKR